MTNILRYIEYPQIPLAGRAPRPTFAVSKPRWVSIRPWRELTASVLPWWAQCDVFLRRLVWQVILKSIRWKHSFQDNPKQETTTESSSSGTRKIFSGLVFGRCFFNYVKTLGNLTVPLMRAVRTTMTEDDGRRQRTKTMDDDEDGRRRTTTTTDDDGRRRRTHDGLNDGRTITDDK